MPRMYEPIWELLKKNKKVSISAPRALHKKLVKAVIKEKDIDVGYKIELDDNEQRARITHQCVGNVIHFQLHLTVGLSDL